MSQVNSSPSDSQSDELTMLTCRPSGSMSKYNKVRTDFAEWQPRMSDLEYDNLTMYLTLMALGYHNMTDDFFSVYGKDKTKLTDRIIEYMNNSHFLPCYATFGGCYDIDEFCKHSFMVVRDFNHEELDMKTIERYLLPCVPRSTLNKFVFIELDSIIEFNKKMSGRQIAINLK